MRAVIVSTIDLPTYCRTMNSNMQAQVRCLYTEAAMEVCLANTRARPVTEAEAERHLKGVLERSGLRVTGR